MWRYMIAHPENENTKIVCIEGEKLYKKRISRSSGDLEYYIR